MSSAAIPAPLRPLARAALWLVYPLLRIWWLIARPRLRGVQCVILRDRDVLLVRHSYGDRRRWELPGGATKRGERPRDTAVREMREELGLELPASRWSALGDLSVRVDQRRGVLCCFAIEADGFEPRIDGVEVRQARWFARDALPPRSGTRVRRVVALAARSTEP